MTILLHPDRYSLTGTVARKTGIVVHDSESSDGSFSSLFDYLKRPGDRPNGRGGYYGSGYHAITNGLGDYVQVADATAGPYAAPPCNKTHWHICMPGRASQTREEWLDDLSSKHMLGVAKFIVDKSAIDGIPLKRLTVPQLVNGDNGYCSHWDVSLAWKQTTHTDPGANFPWDILAGIIINLTTVTPPIETREIMPYLIRPYNDAAVFIVTDNFATWAISQQHIDKLQAANMLAKTPVLVVDPMVLQTLTLCGRAPDYTAGDGGMSGRTTGASFAKHLP